MCDTTKMHAENGIDLREQAKPDQLDLCDALVQTNKQTVYVIFQTILRIVGNFIDAGLCMRKHTTFIYKFDEMQMQMQMQM